MNSIEQQVTKALNGLGTTSRGIADTLANKGVKGYRNCTDVCVLAVYLDQQFPEFRFALSTSAVLVCGGPMNLELAAAPLDEPAMGFVHDFDQGHYPELEAS